MKQLFVILCIFLFSACSENETAEQPKINWNQDKSVSFNKELAIEEELQISMYVERNFRWKFEKTGTGLRICYLEKGKGQQAKVGDYVQVESRYELIDGTLCYETKSDELESFRVDKSDIETGVQEAIKKMHVGDKVKLIIPFRLAQGLVGDRKQIPPLSTLIVDLYLISIGNE
ncbi:MAG: FKBP-type peptidyl-prolyl cis-trans isomerase [Crocinitomicaceae bacterium]|nr:FKBP-type peptidyl-prolyl cis-trans isomerase [Crocinitomicaceae bacterium]